MTDARRRKKELQAARREEERRRAQRREFRRRALLGVGIGVALAVVFLVNAYLSSRPQPLPSAYAQYREQPTACRATAPTPEQLDTFEAPSDQGIGSGDQVTARLQTSCGDLVVTLDPAGAPETVNSFVFLAREGYYDGTVFHRILEGFVAQGGDPSADGTGGPGYKIADEYPADGFVYEPGVVAMANRGSGTTGSQFFIVLGENAAALNPRFNVLGTVVEGAETLSAIGAVPTALSPTSAEKSVPLETVYVEAVEIEVAGES